MKVFKEQIQELITFWECELEDRKAEGHDSLVYEDFEECTKIIRLLRVLKADIELSELKENYIPRMES